MITVRFEDTSNISYVFTPSGVFHEPWPTAPRVGDHILDLNEFQYEVTKVLWYYPTMVRVYVRRVS